MSFPAIEVLKAYRGMPGFQSHMKMRFLYTPSWFFSVELGLLRLAEEAEDPPNFWDLRRPIEAMMESRECAL